MAVHDASALNLTALGKRKEEDSQDELPGILPFHIAGSNGEYFRSQNRKRIKWRDKVEDGPTKQPLCDILVYEMVYEELQVVERCT